MYDYTIVGGGIGGLHLSLRIQEKHPYAKILILEKYGYTGGRIATERPKELDGGSYEAGAGRIHSSHAILLGLVKQYKLNLIELGKEVDIRFLQPDGTIQLRPSNFDKLRDKLLRKIHREFGKRTIRAEDLWETTLYGIAKSLIGKEFADEFLKECEYTTDILKLRADLSLELMKIYKRGVFFIVKEGLDTLIKCMMKELKPSTIHNRCTVTRFKTLQNEGEQKYQVFYSQRSGRGKEVRTEEKEVFTRTLIFTIPVAGLAKIPNFQRFPLLKETEMEPLMRIYAIYPKGVDGKVWFHDVKRTVTDSPIRYIIPINPSKGLIMISYTDGPDALFWNEQDKAGKLEATLQKLIHDIFPEKTIPAPTYLKTHMWLDGVSYWKPSKEYGPNLLATAQKPFIGADRVFIANESLSPIPGWIEGPLHMVERLIERL